MTKDNLSKIIKKTLLALSLLTAACGNGTNNRGDDDDDNNDTIEWPSECRIKDYVEYTCDDCEDMSGTYSVHKGSDCNLKYSQIDIKQFPEQRSGIYEVCSGDPGCQSFVFATDSKTKEKVCLNFPNTTYYVQGNSLNITDGVLTRCNDEVIKMDRGDCKYWLKKEGLAPNVKYDFSKFGSYEGTQKSEEICSNLN